MCSEPACLELNGSETSYCSSSPVHQLMLLAQVERLDVLATAEVPHMQLMAVAACQQNLRVQAVLDHVGRAPLAGDHGVAAQVPPEVVGQLLWPAILLPRALDLEA